MYLFYAQQIHREKINRVRLFSLDMMCDCRLFSFREINMKKKTQNDILVERNSLSITEYFLYG